MPDYIFDTTVLSNFASAGSLDLLDQRYRGVAFTTEEVIGESTPIRYSGYLDRSGAPRRLFS